MVWGSSNNKVNDFLDRNGFDIFTRPKSQEQEQASQAPIAAPEQDASAQMSTEGGMSVAPVPVPAPEQAQSTDELQGGMSVAPVEPQGQGTAQGQGQGQEPSLFINEPTRYAGGGLTAVGKEYVRQSPTIAAAQQEQLQAQVDSAQAKSDESLDLAALKANQLNEIEAERRNAEAQSAWRAGVEKDTFDYIQRNIREANTDPFANMSIGQKLGFALSSALGDPNAGARLNMIVQGEAEKRSKMNQLVDARMR